MSGLEKYISFRKDAVWLGQSAIPLKNVGAATEDTDATNKAQMDAAISLAITGTLEGANNVFTGNNTHSGTETFNGAVVLAGTKSIASSANAAMFAAFIPAAAQQALSGAGAVNVTTYFTALTTTGAAQALTLANGVQIGQLKKIQHVVDGGSAVLTPTSLSGGTTITFTTVGEQAVLMWNGSAWVAIELSNTATPGTPPSLA